MMPRATERHGTQTPATPPQGHGPTIPPDDFAQITNLIHEETGIVIGQAKHGMLVARLSHRLTALGLADFRDYARLLESPAGAEERTSLISAITTNVTRFFREPHHFEALAALTPRLLQKARSGQRVRLWSAGCSTGQEAYSIAATLLASAPEIAGHDVRILATDIDRKVIETARDGLYDARQTGSDAPAHLWRHMAPAAAEGMVSVSDDLRSLIRFEPLNLLGPWPFSGLFDVVFCRNVVIYFDPETRLRLWRRLAGQIVPEGTLFIGHAERMDPELDDLFTSDGMTRYRRTGKAAPAQPPRKSLCPSETR